MKKDTMIRQYRRFSGADSYILGFIYKKDLYMIEVEKLMPRWMRVERTSAKNGSIPKLQLRLINKDMEQLIRKGAENLGLASEYFDKVKNKGVEFERLIYTLNNQEPRKKDSVGFWVCGDINLDGREVQIKLNGAQIVAENTLHNLQKKARVGG